MEVSSSSTSVTAPSRRKRVLRFVRFVAIVYLLVMLLLTMVQEWLIFPGQASQGKAYARIEPRDDSELVSLTTSDGNTIYVLYGAARTRQGGLRNDASSRVTFIFFYGNAMCLADAEELCRDWRKLGVNVLGVEYPGYGLSSGKPGEQSIYAAADAAYEYLLTRSDIDHRRIVPLGLSIGTGAAVELAARKPVGGLVLLSPFTSLDDLARHSMPWLPTSLMLKHHFHNERKIGPLQIPILIVHGRQDRIIPYEMSERLVTATNGRATKLLVNADHNDLFIEAGDEIDAALQAFVDQLHAAP